MTVEEIKSYFDEHFFIERLSSNEIHKELIKHFEAPKQGEKLGDYLHKKAWMDDEEGETKVYLIKNKKGFLVAFFSVKCGLLYDSHKYEKLIGDELEFVDLIVEQLEMDLPEKGQTIQAYYEYYEQISCERKDQLIVMAYQRYEDSEEEKISKDGRSIKRVHETYSAIEITHFCKNSRFEYDIDAMRGVSLGAGLFWIKIIPRIEEAIKIIGCKYLYLFAADNSDYDKVKSLVRYYKDDFKFVELQDLMVIKPDYDRNCQSMVQEVAELKKNGRAFWARYR